MRALLLLAIAALFRAVLCNLRTIWFVHLWPILCLPHLAILCTVIRAIQRPLLLAECCSVSVPVLRLVVLCAEIRRGEVRVVRRVIEIVRSVVITVDVVSVYVVGVDVVAIYVVDVSVVVVIPVNEGIGVGDVYVAIVNDRGIVPPASP